MSFRFRPPSNEDDFELFCLRFLRALWDCPNLNGYGKRGERQHGVDLIDESGGKPFRAVQCKHHESDKTIPPSEIEGEVVKAVGAPFALDEYFILTTARKTTQGQNAIIRINREHQTKGSFKVIVWVWEDIEERLSQLDDATQEQVTHGDTGRSGPAICRMLSATLADHAGLLSASASVIDLELEAAKGMLDRHEVEVAEHKLREVESRSASRFQPQHCYLLKILRSRIYTARWEWEKAGREILAAVQHTPSTERARINEALGHELVGDREKAYAIADQLRPEYPQSVRLITIWVRTAPSDIPLSTLVEAASPFANDDEELNLALALRSLSEGRFDDGLKYATRATELDVESPHSWFILGQAKHGMGYPPTSARLRGTLAEAEGHYSRACGLAKGQKLPGLEAAIRVNRAKLRHVLDLTGVDADFAAAIELVPNEDGARAEYVAYLLELDRHTDALTVLAGSSGEPTTAHLFYEAVARDGRNDGDDRVQAVELLGRVIAGEPGERWVDAHIFLVQAAVESHTQPSARLAIAGSRLRAVNPVVYHTLCGWLAQSEGQTDDAKSAYRHALASLTVETDRENVFLLAQALANVGDDESALPLFQRTYQSGVFNLPCRKLLGCAQRLNRHEVVCRVCRQLREAGETDPRIVTSEIQTLQMYDPHEALRVAAEYLANHPANRQVALWQSALALRLDRSELLISDLTRLPEAGDLTPEGTGLVVGILSEAGQHADALRYAYQALRAHFDDEFVHGQFVLQFLRLSAHCRELAVGGTAQPGAAVCYREDRSDEDQWLVIEDEPDPELVRREFAPDHPVSRALSRLKVGESVVLSDGLQPRTATIREAFHKYIYRFRDCLNQFQVRFPGATAIQLIHVGTPAGGFDFAPIIKGLEEQKTHVETLDREYRSKLFPLYAYAKLAGRDEIAAWGHLTADPTLGIRCCSEPMDDLRTAVPQFARCKTVVLDFTALNTLGQLDLLAVLASKTHTFVVAQTTFERLQHFAEVAEEDRRSEGSLTLVGGQLANLPVTPEQRDKYARYLGSLEEAVRQNCRILPGTKAADLEPKRRDDLVQVLGRHNLDSILLAAEPDVVLWTDDLALGVVGRMDFRAARVWTQAVLFALHQQGALTRVQYCQAVAKLVGLHYHSTQCNADTLIAAAEVAEWDTRRWPMPQVLRTLGNAASNPVHRIGAAAEAIRTAWRRDLPLLTRQGYVFAVLVGLGSVRLVRRLIDILPAVFSLDVFAADEVVWLVRYWLQHPTGLVRP